jgi:hypothetical protein
MPQALTWNIGTIGQIASCMEIPSVFGVLIA